MTMKPLHDLDYVELYAQKIRDDPALFKQQQGLIRSQLQASSSLFRKMFSGKDFKTEARKYLKGRGLL